MVNQQKKRKRKKALKSFIIVVSVIISLHIFILGIIVLYEINPYDTKEKRQVKPVYKAAMKGVPGFWITDVFIDGDGNYATFRLSHNDLLYPNRTDEEKLELLYKATKQLEDYLNKNDWAASLYSEYGLQFQRKKSHVLACKVKYIDQEAVFYRFYNISFDGAMYSITDFYMMEDVRVMDNFYLDKNLDKEKLEKISKFENLEKVSFVDFVDKEALTVFAKIMNKNNPECKIFVGDEEFILPE